MLIERHDTAHVDAPSRRLYSQAELDAAVAAERERLQAATALCDKHQPSGGSRGQCVICSGEALSAALSKISYLCSEPNDMGVGPYDVDYDEGAVVEQVARMRADLQLDRTASDGIRMLGAIKRAEAEHRAMAGREIYSLHVDQHMHTAEALRRLHAELSSK